MNEKFLDVVVAKPYTVNQNGKPEQRTAWNKVGRAWLTVSGEALNLELFMFSNQRFVIQFNTKAPDQSQPKGPTDSAPL